MENLGCKWWIDIETDTKSAKPSAYGYLFVGVSHKGAWIVWVRTYYHVHEKAALLRERITRSAYHTSRLHHLRRGACVNSCAAHHRTATALVAFFKNTGWSTTFGIQSATPNPIPNFPSILSTEMWENISQWHTTNRLGFRHDGMLHLFYLNMNNTG